MAQSASARHQVLRATVKRQAAAPQRDDVVAETSRHVDLVEHDDHRPPLLAAEPADEGKHVDLVSDVERRDRFVQE